MDGEKRVLELGALIVFIFLLSTAYFSFLPHGRAPVLSYGVTVSVPVSGATVSSPFVVKGVAPSSWYFEGQFRAELLDPAGTVLAQVPARALSDWTTSGPVPFEADFSYTIPNAENATVVLSNDNPSGISANSKSVSVPLSLK